MPHINKATASLLEEAADATTTKVLQPSCRGPSNAAEEVDAGARWGMGGAIVAAAGACQAHRCMPGSIDWLE